MVVVLDLATQLELRKLMLNPLTATQTMSPKLDAMLFMISSTPLTQCYLIWGRLQDAVLAHQSRIRPPGRKDAVIPTRRIDARKTATLFRVFRVATRAQPAVR